MALHRSLDDDPFEGLPEPDVDVCLSCGHYYGMTQGLIQHWRELYNPGPKDVMPQQCWKCLG